MMAHHPGHVPIPNGVGQRTPAAETPASATSNQPTAPRLRLLLVSDRFPPSIGGIQLAGAEMARAFSRLGMDVLVATATPGAVAAPEYDLAVFPANRFADEAFALAERWRADVVFLNGIDAVGAYPFPLERSRIPVVYRSHAAGGKFVFFRNRPPFFGIGVWLKSLLRVFRNARRGRFLAKDVFLGKSPSFSNSTDLLFSTLIHPGNVAAISNAVPSLRRQNSPFRASRGIPEDALLFLSVANYCDRKGQVPLVRAFRSFSERNARLVCIGSEPNETYREAVAAAAGDERILCLADIGREEVVDAINACDVAVLFSNHEAQPLFLLEAMSCGKPWISTDVGFVSEMEGGRILAHRNRRCLHAALAEMADPAVRTSLGEEGLRHWRDHCSPDVVYRQWDALLREVATHGATA